MANEDAYNLHWEVINLQAFLLSSVLAKKYIFQILFFEIHFFYCHSNYLLQLY